MMMMDQGAKDWNDEEDCVLQQMWQPVANELLDVEYEAMEKHQCKYDLYENALKDLFCEQHPLENRTVWQIMIMGAGRGGLIHAVENAAERANVKVCITAIEKNTIGVKAMQQQKWKTHDTIRILDMDVRAFDRHKLKHFDIFVSELLGSFADNELAPEVFAPIVKHSHAKAWFMPS